MLEGLDWGSVLSVVFALFATIAGGFWLKAKGKLDQLRDVAKEGYEAIQTVVAAVEDDKITPEEQVAIKAEALEAWAAIKVLLSIKKKV